jgi:hypothetical protein
MSKEETHLIRDPSGMHMHEDEAEEGIEEGARYHP